jgi:hypothetical protein
MIEQLAAIGQILILIEITLFVLAFMVGRYLYIKHPELYTIKDLYKGTIWDWLRKRRQNKEDQVKKTPH